MLLVGEAGGLINAYGEGIPPALYSGKFAAESIIEVESDGGDVNQLYSKKVNVEKRIAMKELQMR